MLDAQTVEIIIQGGSVGILFTFGVGFFILARLAINRGFEFVTNHLEHNTEAVKEGTEITKEVVLEIRRLSNKLDK